MELDTIAKAPGSCELNKLLNRDWEMQIKPKGAEPSEWIFARGLTSIEVNVETNTVETSDLNSQGWKSETKTSRSLMIKVEGNFTVVNGQTTLEPSQLLLRKTGEELGYLGEIDVRVWRSDGTVEGWEATFTNKYSTPGGDADGIRKFSADMQSTCAPRRIAPVKVGEEKKASTYVNADGKPIQGDGVGGPKPEAKTSTVTLPEDVSGGTWSLTVDGVTAEDLAHNASGEAIQSALSLAGARGVTVSGSAGGPYTVTGGTRVTANGEELTGGDNTTITVK